MHLRIAIADDETEVLRYFYKALVQSGYHVVATASNGRDLVEQCRAQRPDLLITDIRMDGMSGVEAMHELGKDGPIPTILISAHFRPNDFDFQRNDQVVAFLQKPVKLAGLLAAVAEAANRIA